MPEKLRFSQSSPGRLGRQCRDGQKLGLVVSGVDKKTGTGAGSLGKCQRSIDRPLAALTNRGGAWSIKEQTLAMARVRGSEVCL